MTNSRDLAVCRTLPEDRHAVGQRREANVDIEGFRGRGGARRPRRPRAGRRCPRRPPASRPRLLGGGGAGGASPRRWQSGRAHCAVAVAELGPGGGVSGFARGGGYSGPLLGRGTPSPPAAPRRASSRRTFNSLPTRHWRHSHALPERAPRGCSAACVESASVARGRADGRVGRGRGAARYPWLRTLPPRASRKRCGSVPEELEDRRKGRDESERDQRRGRTCDGAPRDLTVAQHCVE
jgi:hypothetical protein